MNQKLPFLPVVLAAVALLFSGCSDGVKEKEAVQQAIRKQSEIQQFRFSGSGSFGWDTPGAASSSASNLLTTALAGAVNGAQLEWSGIASYNPVRLETNVQMTTRSGNSFQIPFLIKDNKMYAQIPLLNKKDEYYSFDLAKPAGSSSPGALPSDALARTRDEMTRMLDSLLSGVEPKWFKEDKLDDAGAGKQYSIEITEANAAELSKQMEAGLDGWTGQLQAITGGTWSGPPKLAGMQLQAPGYIRLGVNPESFLEQISLDLNALPAASSPAPGTYRFKLDYSLSDINEPISFEQNVPAAVKPFEDLWKLLPKK
ncbi:hypothetical protein [Paenibacillus oceani]|uniref:Lipoprotein n=1 Tax=Paenibacillus oceani TaxID=2772510 RepID=A0A927C5L6_9BACL|nr:hypothetical protein [Paenibacillus oceani]MBD2861794.1 hypothetical protein [Paenibacillus oceani]